MLEKETCHREEWEVWGGFFSPFGCLDLGQLRVPRGEKSDKKAKCICLDLRVLPGASESTGELLRSQNSIIKNNLKKIKDLEIL